MLIFCDLRVFGCLISGRTGSLKFVAFLRRPALLGQLHSCQRPVRWRGSAVHPIRVSPWLGRAMPGDAMNPEEQS